MIVVGLLVTIPLATQLLVLLSTVAYVLYDDWTVKQCFEFCSVPAGIFRASAEFGAMDPPIMFCSKCRTVLVWTGIPGEILVFWERQAFWIEWFVHCVLDYYLVYVGMEEENQEDLEIF